MKTLENTTVGKSDGTRLPIIPGTFPAHVSEFSTKEWNGSIVFNIKYKIAPEAKQLTVDKMFQENNQLMPVTDAEGNPVTISAAYMSGKEFFGSGIWLTPNPEKGEGWKNRKYQQVCENLGIVFDKNKDEETIHGEIEEEAIIGMPAIIKLAKEEYQKDGETRHAWKVYNIYPWKEGNRMSGAEIKSDVPF